jgi:tetratricopeptide (TPR) repeat protein
MLSKNTIRLIFSLILLLCASCTTGTNGSQYAFLDSNQDIVDSQQSTAATLKVIDRFSDRCQSREKKAEILRLSYHLYSTGQGGEMSAMALAKSAFLAADIESSQEKRLAMATIGSEAAISAGALEDSPEASYYYALNLGLILQIKGLAALSKLDDLKRALEHCQKDTTLDFGGPQRVLGMLYLKAPAWPRGFGDLDYALELLGEAVRSHPDFPQNHLFFAEALLSEGLLTDAKSQLMLASHDLNSQKWGVDYTVLWDKEINSLLKKINGS